MSAKLLTGQVAVSGTPRPLTTDSNAAHQLRSFILKALVTNANPLYFGTGSVTPTTGYMLAPGEYFTFEYVVESGQVVYGLYPDDVFVVGTAPDRACWVQAGTA